MFVYYKQCSGQQTTAKGQRWNNNSRRPTYYGDETDRTITTLLTLNTNIQTKLIFESVGNLMTLFIYLYHKWFLMFWLLWTSGNKELKYVWCVRLFVLTNLIQYQTWTPSVYPWWPEQWSHSCHPGTWRCTEEYHPMNGGGIAQTSYRKIKMLFLNK